MLSIIDDCMFTEGHEEPVVSVYSNGFSVPEITIMEGQVIGLSLISALLIKYFPTWTE